MTFLELTAIFVIDFNQRVPKVILEDVSLNFIRVLTVTIGVTHNIVSYSRMDDVGVV